MCYDIKKGNDIEKKQVDNIDHIRQIKVSNQLFKKSIFL